MEIIFAVKFFCFAAPVIFLYNNSMRQIVIIAVGIFLFVWGVGLFFGYLSGVSKFSPPVQKAPLSGARVADEQKRAAEEAEEMKRKTMEDLRYQMQRYKDTKPMMGPTLK